MKAKKKEKKILSFETILLILTVQIIFDHAKDVKKVKIMVVIAIH